MDIYKIARLATKIGRFKDLIEKEPYIQFRKALCIILKESYGDFYLEDERSIDRLLWQISKFFRCACGEYSIRYYSYSSHMYRQLRNLLQKSKPNAKIPKRYMSNGICIDCVEQYYCKRLVRFPLILDNDRALPKRIYANYKDQIISVGGRSFLIKGTSKYNKYNKLEPLYHKGNRIHIFEFIK